MKYFITYNKTGIYTASDGLVTISGNKTEVNKTKFEYLKDSFNDWFTFEVVNDKPKPTRKPKATKEK